MPVQVAKSKLAAKYGAGLGKSVMAHAKDETKVGNQGLPPGLKGAIAKLVSCKFDVYKTGTNAGEFYYQARGVMEQPIFFPYKGLEVKIKGQQTMVMIPVFDQKGKDGKVYSTQDEQVARILNEMRLLAGDEFADQITQVPPNLKSDQEKAIWAAEKLEAMTAQLNATNNKDEPGIFFNVSTVARKTRQKMANGKPLVDANKNPIYENGDLGIYENWHGACAYDPSTGTSAAEDESANHSVVPQESAAETTTETKVVETPTTEVSSDPTLSDEEIAGLDIPTLVELASGDTGDAPAATERLAALGAEVGIDVTAPEYQSWSEVGDAIRASQAEAVNNESSASEVAPEEPWKPEVNAVYYYKVIDPKTKKPIMDLKTKKEKKSVQVQVMAIDEKKQTVKLKNLEDGKSLYLNQPYDSLLGDDSGK